MQADLTDFEVSLGLLFSTDRIYTDDQLKTWIVTMYQLNMPGALSLSVEQIQAIERRLKASIQTTQEDSRVLFEKHKEWLSSANSKFSHYERYVRYLKGRGFAKGPLAAMTRDTDKVVGLLADPNSGQSISKRGLVVGNVQSGKTGNFIGVMCRAADVGYKVIVVLTGIQEDLRRQTQERIDFAFMGRHWDMENQRYTLVGVGKDHQEHPQGATRSDSDFKRSLVSNISVSGLNTPLVFVCKKNVTMLQNLRDWIEGQKTNGMPVNSPFLLIDDEADNASINTRDKEDPTRINASIRDLLLQFKVANYVGYTATPFANIFIEPPTEQDMEHEDLFPRDFILALEPPSNYVGTQSIFSDGGELSHSVIVVDDHLPVLPESHKQTLRLEQLPGSCVTAIHDFFIASAIRYCRGQQFGHMSMMINVSRFISIQQQAADLVLAEVIEVQQAIKVFGAVDTQATGCQRLASIRSEFLHNHSDSGLEWREVLARLIEFAPTVIVRTINGRSPDKLDYRRHKAGLHVIAVGGLALSRGFTLEGLSTTYILRNAQAYDTLLQMGRWFGYRDDYADLCRIYMSRVSRDWYMKVHEVTTELYVSFYEMVRQGRKPLNFGLRVRRLSATFSITARNKMRTAQFVREVVDLQNVLIETHTVDIKDLVENLALTQQLIASAPFRQSDNGSALVCTLGRPEVSRFLQSFRYCSRLQKYWTSEVLSYLATKLDEAGFHAWDVALYTGEGERTFTVGNNTYKMQFRTCDDSPGPGILRINAGKMRVASRGAERVGLTDDEIKAARQDYRDDPQTKVASNVADKYYRRRRSKPLLMVHLIEPHAVGEVWEENGGSVDCLVAIGLSIPPCDALAAAPIEYAVNMVDVLGRIDPSAPLDEDDE